MSLANDGFTYDSERLPHVLMFGGGGCMCWLGPGCRVTGNQSRREAAVGRTSAEKAQAPQALRDLCVQHLFTRASAQPTMTNQCVREDVGWVCWGVGCLASQWGARHPPPTPQINNLQNLRTKHSQQIQYSDSNGELASRQQSGISVTQNHTMTYIK